MFLNKRGTPKLLSEKYVFGSTFSFLPIAIVIRRDPLDNPVPAGSGKPQNSNSFLGGKHEETSLRSLYAE